MINSNAVSRTGYIFRMKSSTLMASVLCEENTRVSQMKTLKRFLKKCIEQMRNTSASFFYIISPTLTTSNPMLTKCQNSCGKKLFWLAV
jgi:hypothetical protein